MESKKEKFMKKVLKAVILMSITLTLVASYAYAAIPKQAQAESEYLLAEKLYNQKDYDGAIEHVEKARSLLGKSNWRIEYLLTKAYFSNGDYDKAMKSVNAFFELTPCFKLFRRVFFVCTTVTDNYHTPLVEITVAVISAGIFRPEKRITFFNLLYTTPATQFNHFTFFMFYTGDLSEVQKTLSTVLFVMPYKNRTISRSFFTCYDGKATHYRRSKKDKPKR